MRRVASHCRDPDFTDPGVGDTHQSRIHLEKGRCLARTGRRLLAVWPRAYNFTPRAKAERAALETTPIIEKVDAIGWQTGGQKTSFSVINAAQRRVYPASDIPGSRSAPVTKTSSFPTSMRHGIRRPCRYGARFGHARPIACFYSEDDIGSGIERDHPSDPRFLRCSLQGVLLCQCTICTFEVDWDISWVPFFSPGFPRRQGVNP